jgi:hypothetical protein
MGEKLTFYKLISEKNYTIDIPIIQRDYAQGRDSASEIRRQFLIALKDYLSGDKSVELDFIYGSIISDGETSLFTPLDGQQRLTTLFLLHWYLAYKENRLSELREALLSKGKTKFSYETRITSRDFCNALISNDIILTNIPSALLSETIKDSSWFFSSWETDPTIKSMLVVLDEINKVFSATEGFYEKLISSENPIICFQFIELKDFGLTDSLYVKMNSRGKELTNFENFKAKFEQYIEKLDQENGTDIKAQFSKKIDTDWTDLFWNYKNTATNVFDSQLMNFICTLAVNNYTVKQRHSSSIERYIKTLSDSSKSASFNQYELDEECLQDIIETLDYLKNGSEKIKTFLGGTDLINENSLFYKVVNNQLTYPDRILFFSLYKYLITNEGDISGLYDWMRVMRNLTLNTIYDADGYSRSIKSVNRLLSQSADILSYFSNPASKIDGFVEIQIQEERIKAILLLKKDEWRQAITRYENHGYFVGQIDFLLKFSGIKDYYELNEHLDWTDEENRAFLESFIEYGNKAATMFSSHGLNDFGEYLWERALLSKGDYTLVKARNYSFLINDDRDISWKRLLRDDDKQRDYLKLLFDQINVETVKDDLERIIDNDNSDNWRRYFIKRPEILAVCGDKKFIRWDSDEDILLLERNRTNGQHREYYSYALKVKLENLGNKVSYVESNSVDFLKYISSINRKSVQISFWSGRYRFKVRENVYEAFTTEQEIIEFLIQNKYIVSPEETVIK